MIEAMLGPLVLLKIAVRRLPITVAKMWGIYVTLPKTTNEI